jgi:hypothetical protein
MTDSEKPKPVIDEDTREGLILVKKILDRYAEWAMEALRRMAIPKRKDL